MSANLLDGGTTYADDGTTYSGGVWSVPANDTNKINNAVKVVPSGTEAVAEDQTLHVGFSVRAADGASMSLPCGIGYIDAAGHINWASRTIVAQGTGSWQRVEGSLVMPSGMRVSIFFVHQGAGSAACEVTNPTLSYGLPVTLASGAHTPYATQDHLRSEYATKAALKVTSDAVTAEVEERGKLAGRVGTLESTTGTHTSRLEQLASSIRSLVKGESTYTDPDGVSATSGIYSLVTQTRDAVTALFGDYTKTADLASTQAVKDAKKAGTDAQATAATAQGTANGAKSTADSLATLIRADSTGVTVGKSADGETWSTGRTRMTDSAFQVLDKAGAVITQLAADGASFLSGLVRIVAGKATLPGNETVNSIVIDAGDGVAGMHGIISRLDATINGIKSSVSAGWEQDFGSGVVLVSRDTSTNEASAFAVYPYGVRVNGGMTVSGTIGLADEASTLGTRRGLRISQGSKVCHGHGTPWVTLFESWDEFQSATGCYDSGTPTLVTMNGDWGAFDGTLSGCEICGGKAVYVMAETTSGLPNISSTQSLRIDWICIW